MDNDNNDEVVPINEICLPDPSSQLGRDSQWLALVNAYRRVAGVPGGGGGASRHNKARVSRDHQAARGSNDCKAYIANLDIVKVGGNSSESSINFDNKNDNNKNGRRRPSQSASTIQTSSMTYSIDVGAEIVMIQGNAGTGKSFLVQKLQKEILAANNTYLEEGGALMRHQRDDMTAATKSVKSSFSSSFGSMGSLGGGSSNHHQQREITTTDYSELPGGLFAQGCFTHGDTTSMTPYSAITDAFNDVIEQLLSDGLVDPELLRLTLVHALGSDVTKLLDIVPCLRCIIWEEDHYCPEEEGEGQ